VFPGIGAVVILVLFAALFKPKTAPDAELGAAAAGVPA
jgi:hypothetical protein